MADLTRYSRSQLLAMNLMHLNMQRERKIGAETINTTYISRIGDGRRHLGGLHRTSMEYVHRRGLIYPALSFSKYIL